MLTFDDEVKFRASGEKLKKTAVDYPKYMAYLEELRAKIEVNE